MFKIACFLLLVLVLSAFLGNAAISRRFTGTLYYVDGNVNAAWDASEGATYYELESVWWHPSDSTQDIVYPCTKTPNLEATCIQKRAGHFKIRVRAGNADGISDWNESIDINGSTVDGQPGAWLIYWLMPAPQIIIIN